jgi:flagellar biosynthesis/type III secretory pathway protein FliH
MYSLLPTMKGAGARLLMRAIDEMAEYYRGNNLRLSSELLRFGLLLRRAERIPPDEKHQVEEKLSMWDNLIEQDPKIRQIRAESERIGEERGIAQGVEQGIEQGVVAMQSTAQNTLKERFPLLATTAYADIERIKSLDALQHLIMEIIVARDEATARRAIDAHLP